MYSYGCTASVCECLSLMPTAFPSTSQRPGGEQWGRRVSHALWPAQNETKQGEFMGVNRWIFQSISETIGVQPFHGSDESFAMMDTSGKMPPSRDPAAVLTRQWGNSDQNYFSLADNTGWLIFYTDIQTMYLEPRLSCRKNTGYCTAVKTMDNSLLRGPLYTAYDNNRD